MFRKLLITDVYAREILDSRGNPTLQAEVTVADASHRQVTGNHMGEWITGKEYTGVASVPSGASTGKFEAVELRDGEPRYFGLGVSKAVMNVNTKIKDALIGQNGMQQRKIDHMLLDLDGTENKSNLGANAMLGVSMALAKACAKALDIPLYQYLGGINTYLLPVPMMNILNGGKHADNTVDFQEFMIIPVKEETFKERLRICAEIYHNLKKIINKSGLSTGVGDEGGFAPNLPNARAVLDLIMQAVQASGYRPGEDVQIALDVAASELYNKDTKMYHFEGETKVRRMKDGEEAPEVVRSTSDMIHYYEELIKEYPVASIEDGLAEEDWDGWVELTKCLGDNVQLVGDDLFVTNKKRLGAGIKLGAANAILIKVNQIGTVTETMETIERAHKNGYRAVVSHRSGETEDNFIADLAVAVGAGQIKTGAPCRSERVAKYNKLLQIAELVEGENITEK